MSIGNSVRFFDTLILGLELKKILKLLIIEDN